MAFTFSEQSYTTEVFSYTSAFFLLIEKYGRMNCTNYIVFTLNRRCVPKKDETS